MGRKYTNLYLRRIVDIMKASVRHEPYPTHTWELTERCVMRSVTEYGKDEDTRGMRVGRHSPRTKDKVVKAMQGKGTTHVRLRNSACPNPQASIRPGSIRDHNNKNREESSEAGSWRRLLQRRAQRNRRMADRGRWVGCNEAFNRVHRNLDWTLRSIRHVNRKLEAHKEGYRAWTTQAEERSVQEWYAQAEINRKLQLENTAQQQKLEEQQKHIDYLYQMLNAVYGELERKKASKVSEEDKKDHQT